MCPVSQMYFKDSYTSVAEVEAVFSEAAAASLFASCSNPNEVLCSNVGPAKGRRLLRLPARSVDVASIRFRLLVSWFCTAAALLFPWQLLSRRGDDDDGAGLPLFNLFNSTKKKKIHNCFCAPIEREHELFWIPLTLISCYI